MSKASLAVGLLREKGHIIGGGNYVSSTGAHRIDVDHVACTPGEAIQFASQYPEWPDMEKQNLQALRAHQQSLASTAD